MLIEDFINNTPDWEQVLAGEPYFVKTIWDGEYFLLKYSQLESDFSNEIVCQCRGSIFKFVDNKCVCVCRPFRKFFNVQEANAAHIDWTTAKVQEKIDGTIIKIWYDNSVWHISTNSVIDAFKATIVDDLTFGQVFERAAGMDLAKFCKFLSPSYTHIFELTSPESQVVIPYSDGIYWLASKNTQTEGETTAPTTLPWIVKGVKTYDLSDLDECLDYVSIMTKDEEGFVVVDDDLNRVKIKSPKWLNAHYLVHNNVISNKYLFKMFQEDKLDDVRAVVRKEWIKKLDVFERFIRDTMIVCRKSYWQVEDIEDDKEFAAAAKETMMPDFCFAHRKYGISPLDYIKRMTYPTFCKYFEYWSEYK